MKQDNLNEMIIEFLSLANPEHRYSSFDYCYNYFYNNNDLTKEMEKSCLELAFYLASWGMFRGSSFLLQKSARHFIKTVEYINSLNEDYWKIDVDNYNSENIEKILEIYEKISEKAVAEEGRELTLVTKIMLGVFGFVPAYDQYFCDTFRKISGTNKKCRFRSFDKESLNIVKDFYDDNKEKVDNVSDNTYTYDFLSGEKTKLKYPKAKIIDMYGFSYGLALSNENSDSSSDQDPEKINP